MPWIALSLAVFIVINLTVLVASLYWGPALRDGDDAETNTRRAA